VTSSATAAARALARAEAAGIWLRLRPDGGVRLAAAAAPPPEVVAELRRHRDEVWHLLALRAAVAARECEEPGSRPRAVAGDAGPLLRAAEQAAAALAAPDPELARDRAETAAAEARGEFGVPTSPAEHEHALADLREAALVRPP
jgi:hypothetical protein